jgi:hypothetical protein
MELTKHYWWLMGAWTSLTFAWAPLYMNKTKEGDDLSPSMSEEAQKERVVAAVQQRGPNVVLWMRLVVAVALGTFIYPIFIYTWWHPLVVLLVLSLPAGIVSRPLASNCPDHLDWPVGILGLGGCLGMLYMQFTTYPGS